MFLSESLSALPGSSYWLFALLQIFIVLRLKEHFAPKVPAVSLKSEMEKRRSHGAAVESFHQREKESSCSF